MHDIVHDHLAQYPDPLYGLPRPALFDLRFGDRSGEGAANG